MTAFDLRKYVLPAETRLHVPNSRARKLCHVAPYLGRFWTDSDGLGLKLKLSTRRNEVFHRLCHKRD